MTNNYVTPIRPTIIITIVLFLLGQFQSFAQEDYTPKLGQIDLASMNITSIDDDSTAEAIVLYDLGKVRYGYQEHIGIYFEMECHVRIKILKESALERGSVTLAYHAGSSDVSEEVYRIEGYTHNLENGQIKTSKLDKKSITYIKLSSDFKATKFNLPNVKKGSVIEYSYFKRTPFKYRDTPGTWNFQNNVPVKWSEFVIKVPYFLNYNLIMRGFLSLYINEAKHENVEIGHSKLSGPGTAYRFVVQNAPAFRDEPYITTKTDYISKISFELSSINITGEIPKKYSLSWVDVDKSLNSFSWFGGELGKAKFLRDKAKEILSKTTDPEKQVELAFDYVKDYMKWDESAALGSSNGIKTAYENKKGNAAEINFILIGLLKEMDLESNPVILSTRSNGWLQKEFPSIENFNYVICQVKIGDKEVLMDASQAYTYPGFLPKHVLNESGRVITSKNNGNFIDILPGGYAAKTDYIIASIDSNGKITGNITMNYTAYEALDWREKWATSEDEAITKEVKSQFTEWQLDSIIVKNKSEALKDPVTISSKFEFENENSTPEMIYLNPIFIDKWLTNPLKSNKRLYPINLNTPISQIYICILKIPDGYTLEEKPTSEIITLQDNGGKFSYLTTFSNNTIQLRSVVEVKRTLFSVAEYDDLRSFFEKIVQKHAHTFVLKKIN